MSRMRSQALLGLALTVMISAACGSAPASPGATTSGMSAHEYIQRWREVTRGIDTVSKPSEEPGKWLVAVLFQTQFKTLYHTSVIVPDPSDPRKGVSQQVPGYWDVELEPVDMEFDEPFEDDCPLGWQYADLIQAEAKVLDEHHPEAVQPYYGSVAISPTGDNPLGAFKGWLTWLLPLPPAGCQFELMAILHPAVDEKRTELGRWTVEGPPEPQRT
jgi:hypothetical protein